MCTVRRERSEVEEEVDGWEDEGGSVLVGSGWVLGGNCSKPEVEEWGRESVGEREKHE